MNVLINAARQIVAVGTPLDAPPDPSLQSIVFLGTDAEQAKLDSPGAKTLSADAMTITVTAPVGGAGTLPVMPGPFTAEERTKLLSLKPVLEGTKSEAMPLLAIGAAVSISVPCVGARAGMVALAAIPAGLTASLTGAPVATIEANDVVTVTLKVGVALAAGTRVFGVRVIQ